MYSQYVVFTIKILLMTEIFPLYIKLQNLFDLQMIRDYQQLSKLKDTHTHTFSGFDDTDIFVRQLGFRQNLMNLKAKVA